MMPRPTLELRALVSQLASLARLPSRVLPNERFDVDVWLDLVLEHRLAPFLGARCIAASSRTDALTGISPTVLSELRQDYLRSARDAAFRVAELSRVSRSLDGVAEPVLLKGAALVGSLYETAGERLMSDVDLLFASDADAHRAKAALENVGYRAIASGDGHHHLPILEHPVRDIRIELHTNLSTPPLDLRVIGELWRTRQPWLFAGDQHPRLCVLDPVGRLLHHAIHAAADPIESPLLRNLFEVAWMVAKLDDATRDRFLRLVRDASLEGRVRAALSLASELFGTPALILPTGLDASTSWCRARLGWTDTFDDTLPWWRRLERHVAMEHVAAVDRGASPRDPMPLVDIALRALRDAVTTRVERAVKWKWSRIAHIPLRRVRVGDGHLVHEIESGRVHLIDDDAGKLLSALEVPTDRHEVVRVLERNGMARGRAEEVLATLMRAGVVHRVADGRPNRLTA